MPIVSVSYRLPGNREAVRSILTKPLLCMNWKWSGHMYFCVKLNVTFAYLIFWSICLDLLLQLVKILPHLIFQVRGSRVALAEGDAVTLICRWVWPSPWRWPSPWIWPWRWPWLIEYDPTHDFCHHQDVEHDGEHFDVVFLTSYICRWPMRWLWLRGKIMVE